MLQLFQRLFETGNIAAGAHVIYALTEADHKIIFINQPRLYAVLVRRLHLKPLKQFQNIVPCIPLSADSGKLLESYRLQKTSHIQYLLAQFLGLEGPHPYQLAKQVLVTPLDFTKLRENKYLAANPPFYFLVQDYDVHASYMCRKVFYAAYELGFSGCAVVYQFANMLPPHLDSLRDTVKHCHEAVYFNYHFKHSSISTFIIASFSAQGSEISSWSFSPMRKIVCDPLYICLAGLQTTRQGDLAISELSVKDFIVRVILTLLEMQSVVTISEWTILLALLSRYYIARALPVYKREICCFADIMEYKAYLLELASLCLPSAGEWQVYVQKLLNQLYLL